FRFNAAVTGEFNDKSYPAEPTLSLKEGAQVMLIKNDKGESRRYYNGKIGIVDRLSADRISIRFSDEPDQLTLEKETWRNIRYHYNKEKDRIEEEELGSFSQYPIRLAWAITIHKSQGLTFQRAVIDAGESFAAGQVYVALSRLTSLEGLVLRSRITPWSIRTDARVAAFLENNPSNEIVEQQLEQEQLSYIGSSLLEAFDWNPLIESLDIHCEELLNHRSRHSTGLDLARAWLVYIRQQQETTEKFIRQINQLLPDAEADAWQRLHQRVEAATTWFARRLDEHLLSPIAAHLTEIRKRKRMKKQDRSLT